MVAVKRIRLGGLSEDDVKQLMREVDVVKSLSHPSIVKYEGMSKDSDTLNIVLEYVRFYFYTASCYDFIPLFILY